ncbi:MAG TPA: RecX family transcriptional regulator [Sphingomonadaceae bacterium]|nr:RecX family transcriptional regulator [Sphingomonadaceae bacterium]
MAMRSADRHNPRQKKPPKPLDHARLEELALAYVARFATSAAKLEAYLARKLRERGWEGEDEPDIPALVSRYAGLGYVDDASYARAKAGGLLRRGYGPRRVNQALNAAGISQEIREGLRAGRGEQRRAALALARKRRFGPFAAAPADRAIREKQIAAMLRAGHSLDNIRELVDAPSPEAAEEWAVGADEAGPEEEEWS